MSTAKKKPVSKPAKKKTTKTSNVKTNNDYTHIMCVLDRSGSMDAIRDDMIGGFNQFLEEQKKLKKKATIDLIQFDNEYEVLMEMKDLDEAKNLTRETYVPRGVTALLDAIGKTVQRNEKLLNNLSVKPGKIICLILTDGQENASHEYTNEQIKTIIKNHTDNDKWTFVYIGANQDSFAVSSNLGIKAGNTANFVSSGVGTRSAMSHMSQTMSSYRCAASLTTDNYFDGTKNLSDPTDNG